jgi:hypothetical protein
MNGAVVPRVGERQEKVDIALGRLFRLAKHGAAELGERRVNQSLGRNR